MTSSASARPISPPGAIWRASRACSKAPSPAAMASGAAAAPGRARPPTAAESRLGRGVRDDEVGVLDDAEADGDEVGPRAQEPAERAQLLLVALELGVVEEAVDRLQRVDLVGDVADVVVGLPEEEPAERDAAGAAE